MAITFFRAPPSSTPVTSRLRVEAEGRRGQRRLERTGEPGRRMRRGRPPSAAPGRPPREGRPGQHRHAPSVRAAAPRPGPRTSARGGPPRSPSSAERTRAPGARWGAIARATLRKTWDGTAITTVSALATTAARSPCGSIASGSRTPGRYHGFSADPRTISRSSGSNTQRRGANPARAAWTASAVPQAPAPTTANPPAVTEGCSRPAARLLRRPVPARRSAPRSPPGDAGCSRGAAR